MAEDMGELNHQTWKQRGKQASTDGCHSHRQVLWEIKLWIQFYKYWVSDVYETTKQKKSIDVKIISTNSDFSTRSDRGQITEDERRNPQRNSPLLVDQYNANGISKYVSSPETEVPQLSEGS